MYLSVMMQDQCTGHYIWRERDSKGGFFMRRSISDASLASTEWMEYLASENDIKIDHMFNVGAEKRIGNRSIPVDGFCKETKTIYQFSGCYYHAHRCAYNHSMPCDNEEDNEARRRAVDENLAYFRGLGYNVVHERECSWRLIKHLRNLGGRCSKMHKKFFPDTRKYLSEEQAIERVNDGTIFGIIECDIVVPESLREKFKDFQPILKSCMVSADDVGQHMKQYCEANNIFKTPRRTLLGSYFANNHLMATDLLQWYLKEGITIKKVHWLVQYHRSKCFATFGNDVMRARRSADLDPTQKIQADTFKLIGNSSFGKTIINKAKFTNFGYADSTDVLKISSSINNKQFKNLEYIGEEIAEIESFKRTISIDSNVIIGFTILERSKLILLKFVHNFLRKYLPKKTFCLLECDTDSMYLSLAGENIFQLVRPELHREFQEEYSNWFAPTYCQQHSDDFFQTLFAGDRWLTENCEDCVKSELHWRREVGLFHVEFESTAFVGLSPKCYYCVGGKDKYSAKGVSKKLNNVRFEDFKSVLDNAEPHNVTNRGFRLNNNSMFTYIQKKVGLAYLYIKRKVSDNGIDTSPTDL